MVKRQKACKNNITRKEWQNNFEGLFNQAVPQIDDEVANDVSRFLDKRC